MNRADILFWGAVLFVGVPLSFLYGASWRAVARALDTTRRAAGPPTGAEEVGRRPVLAVPEASAAAGR